MKYVSYLLILFVTLNENVIAYADNKAKEITGEAHIIVDNETYALPLKKYYSAKSIIEGKAYEAFVIATHYSRRDKEPAQGFPYMDRLVLRKNQKSLFTD